MVMLLLYEPQSPLDLNMNVLAIPIFPNIESSLAFSPLEGTFIYFSVYRIKIDLL